jgi:uncharacterized membrane protein
MAFYKESEMLGATVGGGVLLALAGILVMLAVISLQIGSMRENSWLASAGVMLVAIAAVILAGITGMIGLVMFY